MKELLGKLPVFLRDWKLLLLLLLVLTLMLTWTEGEDGGMTQEERRVAQTLSRVAGAGEVQVTIYYAQSASAFGSGVQTPLGAVAVCEGAGDIGVRLRLAEALETLLGLEAQDVVVLEMEETP